MNILCDLDISGLRILVVKKLYEKFEIGKFVDTFPVVIDHDCDVFKTDGTYLLRFRKNIIDTKSVTEAYNTLNVAGILDKTTDRRTQSSGASKKIVKSNILGYFDHHNTTAIYRAKKNGIVPPDPKKPRECSSTKNFPEAHSKILPFIRAVDRCYKNLCPSEYTKQFAAADLCDPYRISETSFTTVTVNKNYRTALHYDKGDFEEGFGNLTTFQKGNYSGGYTGFPEYGIGVDVRTGDFLAMDVHQPHCNTPIILEDPKSQRISFVCYLREGILKKIKRYS